VVYLGLITPTLRGGSGFGAEVRIIVLHDDEDVLLRTKNKKWLRITEVYTWFKGAVVHSFVDIEAALKHTKTLNANVDKAVEFKMAPYEFPHFKLVHTHVSVEHKAAANAKLDKDDLMEESK